MISFGLSCVSNCFMVLVVICFVISEWIVCSRLRWLLYVIVMFMLSLCVWVVCCCVVWMCLVVVGGNCVRLLIMCRC